MLGDKKGRLRAAPALHASHDVGSWDIVLCWDLGNPKERVANLSRRRALAWENLAWMMSSSTTRMEETYATWEETYCLS